MGDITEICSKLSKQAFSVIPNIIQFGKHFTKYCRNSIVKLFMAHSVYLCQ